MKITVGVLFGGKSTEHEISCISANQVIQAINKEKYEVLPIYISRNDEFYIGEELFDLGNYASFIDKPEDVLKKVAIYKDGNKVLVKTLKGLFNKTINVDVFFPVVHGTNVEDGSLAGFLNMLDVPYTSCDVIGGALGQDKAVMKDVFKANEIAMVDYFIIYGHDFEDNYQTYLAKAKKLKYPLIAKPANLGSSIGIEIIKDEKNFKEKILACLKYDFKIVVEKMITDLKEVNISVIGGLKSAKVSVIEEVSNGFLDYDKKYQPQKGAKTGSKKLANKLAPKLAGSKGMASTARKIPADLSKAQIKTIEQMALKAFRVLNAHGCVRIDFMIDKKTNKVYCNEINTIPGSLAFYLWDYNGLKFDDMCDLLIKNAIERFAQKTRKTYAFETTVLKGYAKK